MLKTVINGASTAEATNQRCRALKRTILNVALFMCVIFLLGGCFFNTQQLNQWQLADGTTSSLALSRDGRFSIAYSKLDHLILWDLLQNKQLAHLGAQDPSSSEVTRIRFSDNGQYAITATQLNFAVWELAWSQSLGLWSISDGTIVDLDVANNGEHVLLGLTNGKAIYVNVETGRRLEFLAHRDKVNSVAISRNGRYALSGGNDYFAYLWDSQTGQALFQFEHEARVNRVALDREGRWAFTSDASEAFIWDIRTGEKVSTLSTFLRQQVFSTARFSDDGTLLITGTPAGKVTVWDVKSGKKLQRWSVESNKDSRPAIAVVYDAAFTPNNSIVAGSSAGIVQEWKMP
jgi:WD40 repeat protein